jgi:hypothetical protein
MIAKAIRLHRAAPIVNAISPTTAPIANAITNAKLTTGSSPTTKK